MVDFLKLLRMNSIFGQPDQIMGNDLPSQGGISGNMPPPTPSIMPPMANPPTPDTPDIMPFDAIGAMGKLYQPKHEASDAFSRLLTEYPNQAEYKPGFLRSIASAITAFGPGGQDAGMDLLYKPYTNKLQDWTRKSGIAERQANLERQENTNNRTLAYQTVSQQLRAEADAEKARHNLEGEEIAHKKADLMDFKARNPNVKFDFSTPTVKVMDPGTGKLVDTGIPTGRLTDAEKMMLNQAQKLEQIQTQGDIQKGLQDDRQQMQGWSIANIPDPNDPTKQIAVRVNAATGAVEPVKLGDQTIPGITKPGTKSGATGQPDPTKLEAIREGAQQTLDLINTHLLDKNGELSDTAKRATGLSSYLNFLPTSKGRAGQNVINQIKGQQILNVIGQLKAQSRTGATGFGQMSIKELAVLENAATRLDTAQDEEDFKVALKEIKDKLEKIMRDPIPGSAASPTNTGTKPSAADLIKKYGGR